jgi:hypothetical protein
MLRAAAEGSSKGKLPQFKVKCSPRRSGIDHVRRGDRVSPTEINYITDRHSIHTAERLEKYLTLIDLYPARMHCWMGIFQTWHLLILDI